MNQYSYFTIDEIQKNHHVNDYFHEFLGDKGHRVTHFFIENDYWSEDFLSDYQEFYSSCFDKANTTISKTCTRVHFFSSDNSLVELKNHVMASLMNLESDEDIWKKDYKGFITIKPIANSLIGFSLLKPYANNNGRERYFWGVREYTVNFFGKNIPLNSLGFQQQDKILGACASIAIWTLYQKICTHSSHQSYSIGQITKSSGIISANGMRLIPNKGLTPKQIGSIITQNGLQPELITGEIESKITYKKKNIISNLVIKKIVNAYHRLGIPIIIGFVPNLELKKEQHAVAVCGHGTFMNNVKKPSFIKKLSQSRRSSGIAWRAEKITKLYAHDDKWGPFSRIMLENKHDLNSAWSFHLNRKKGYALEIIVPVPPKIVTSYVEIEKDIYAINDIIESVIEKDFTGDLVWDLYVMKSVDFKQEMKLNNSVLNNDYFAKITGEILKSAFPKYIWRATCYVSGRYFLDFIFDTTTTKNQLNLLFVVSYHKDLNQTLTNIFEFYRDEVISKDFYIPNSYLEFIINELNNLKDV